MDYPGIISLNKPYLTPFADTASRHQYSQHKVDIIDFEKNIFLSEDVSQLLETLPGWYKKIMFKHDYDTERLLREQGKDKEIVYPSYDGLIEMKDFNETLVQLMSTLQKEYNYPVDIEFTCNFTEHGEFLINLLQCRPLQVGGIGEKVVIPDITDNKIFFELSGGTMGGAVIQPVDIVIQVDPAAYYKFPYKKKYTIARIIGKINQYFKGKEKAVMLITPGRIGTSSPELGLPVSFSEINNIKVICEVSYKDAGYIPELSFGSHLFNDLVETGIFYASIFEDNNTVKFDSNFFDNMKSILPDICTGCDEAADIIKAYDLSNAGLMLFSDIISSRTVCGIFKA